MNSPTIIQPNFTPPHLSHLSQLATGRRHAKAGAHSGAFLFVTFKGEATPLTEQVYFAVSRDGRHWEALNAARPVLTSPLGELGVRDPFIIRSGDGKKFFIIGTDLSINLNSNWGRAVSQGSKSVVIWESTDLVHWSEPRLVLVAAPDAGCTWAPEAIYDEHRGDYLMFWASTSSADHFSKHRIWASRTQDFKTFSPAFVYMDKPHSVIDTTIVRSGDKHYRFFKDEHSKAIILEESQDLMAPWRLVPEFSLAGLRGYEGPQCFLMNPEEPGAKPNWCLLLDLYSAGQGYQPFLTDDLATGQFGQAADFSFPFHFRHGSVLRITEEELTRIQSR